MYPYAWARFVESVISDTKDFNTPIFPFKAPLKHRLQSLLGQVILIRKVKNSLTHLITRPQNVLDSPKEYIDSDKEKSPTSNIGFLPATSLSLDQCNTVIACVAKNNDCIIPT